MVVGRFNKRITVYAPYVVQTRDKYGWRNFAYLFETERDAKQYMERRKADGLGYEEYRIIWGA